MSTFIYGKREEARVEKWSKQGWANWTGPLASSILIGPPPKRVQTQGRGSASGHQGLPLSRTQWLLHTMSPSRGDTSAHSPTSPIRRLLRAEWNVSPSLRLSTTSQPSGRRGRFGSQMAQREAPVKGKASVQQEPHSVYQLCDLGSLLESIRPQPAAEWPWKPADAFDLKSPSP